MTERVGAPGMDRVERDLAPARQKWRKRSCDHATVEVSIKGKWTTVPAAEVGETIIVVRGRVIRVAEVHAEEWRHSDVRNPDACIEALRSGHGRHLRADIFSFSERVPTPQPRHTFPLEHESLAAIPISGFAKWWESLPQESRKNVRRAEKRGVVVEVRDLDDALVDQIVELNNDSAVRQNTAFAHYGKDREQVRKDQSTYLDRSEFICAFLGSELIGLLKLVYRENSAVILQMLPKSSRKDARPANAILAKAVSLCEARGMKYLVYGKYRYGNQGVTSLGEFKRRNGFVEVLVPRYFVPLTIKGRMALALGIQHDLVGILPEPAVRLSRAIRAAWYRLRREAGVAQSAEQPKS